MKKMRAFWWYEPNFGDALNPYILGKLSGKKIIYSPEHRFFFKEEWKRFIKDPFHFDWHRLTWPVNQKKVILAIGSMLEHSKPNYKIWGTGFLYSTSNFPGGEVFALRGRYTAEKIMAQGYEYCHIFGDPALLLPIIYKPKDSRRRSETKIGLIPHYLEYDLYKKKYRNANVINLTTYNVEQIIDEICCCDYILSTSLHGIIVAHAYNIPALYVKNCRNIGGDGIKFKDYFSSVGLPEYAGKFTIEDILGMRYTDFINIYSPLILPKRDKIISIQKELLAVAPFPIKNEFKAIQV